MTFPEHTAMQLGKGGIHTMAHYKRKGPKSTRAGCLLCKPYKRQGSKLLERAPFNQVRKERDAAQQIADVLAR
ncbi:MAG: hypothetical protein WCH75_31255 [Candidatus Binatia bacterium]|jgi:hypothetical protein